MTRYRHPVIRGHFVYYRCHLQDMRFAAPLDPHLHAIASFCCLIVSYSPVSGCAVKVYHKRREQSVDVLSGANNHFELDFEVRATFDRGMEDLTAAGLRVQRLVCAPTMQLEMRIQLESRILGDLIIL